MLPAHRLLHQRDEASDLSPYNKPLSVPSATYDTLRATLVRAELMLLRVLGFELRMPQPLDLLPRYLERAMGDVSNAAEDYDSWDKEDKDEYGVLKDHMETGIGRACRARVVSA